MGAGKGFFTDYPKHVFLILGNEFCERFSFYGMKAILVLFLTQALGFTGDEGTSIYHGFNVACYFMPLIGAMLADGVLGKYKTIFIISIVYAIGNIIMAVGAIPLDGVNFNKALPFTGLVLIAIGTGGIKPCVSAFGADQFSDSQNRQKETFFSMFYMAINLGSLASMIITPIIRSSVTCFGKECYALAFGIPAGLMLVAVVFFIAGTKWYTIQPAGDNILGKLFGCIGTALKGKCSCSGNEKREHWLDYADSDYDKKFIGDVKSVMRVLFMFIPLPVFWALFDQQGSRWILQAGLMNGELGNWVLQPDLIQVLNPLLVVIMVPLMESLLFPCLDKLRIPNSPLQRLGVGMFLAGTAFVVTALIQIVIDRTLPTVIADNQARFKIINAVPCDIMGGVYPLGSNNQLYEFTIPYETVQRTNFKEYKDLEAGSYIFKANFTKCAGPITPMAYSGNFTLGKKKFYNMIAHWNVPTNTAIITQADQPYLKKTLSGKSTFQIFNAWVNDTDVTVEGNKTPIKCPVGMTSNGTAVSYGMPKISADGKSFGTMSKAGAVYTIVLHYSSTNAAEIDKTATQYEDLEMNQVSILWQIPQYVIMSLGEVFFSVTGLSFAYSQAPTSMKAVLQAAWLLTNSFGNLIVMIITAVGKLPNQMAEFFLFAGLMYVTVVIFAIMSLTYKYVEPDTVTDDAEKLPEKLGVDNLAVVTTDEPAPPKYEAVIADSQTSPPQFETSKM